jgi:2-methylcitrate dehydratase PrpD
MVVENNEMTKALPEERAAKVTITLKNGQEYSGEVRDASGSFKEPLSEQELTRKYIAILKNEPLVDRLVNMTMLLDQSKDMNEWVKELREKEQSLL